MIYPVPKPTKNKKEKPKPKSKKNPIPKDILQAVIDRDGGKCQYCGGDATDPHHIVSSGMGRRKIHRKENLMLLCQLCHRLTHSGKDSEARQRWCEDWSRKRYGNMIDLFIEANRKAETKAIRDNL
jgi:5-methylcytosine-specific restriction endonuclease McrA